MQSNRSNNPILTFYQTFLPLLTEPSKQIEVVDRQYAEMRSSTSNNLQYSLLIVVKNGGLGERR